MRTLSYFALAMLAIALAATGCASLLGADFDKHLAPDGGGALPSSSSDGNDPTRADGGVPLACEAGVCVPVCNAPAVPCGDSCCTCKPGQDFSADPKNCGACGHDCLGGACSAGRCEPVELAKGDQLWSPGVDAVHAYVLRYTQPTDAGGYESVDFFRIPVAGGTEEPLTTLSSSTFGFAIGDRDVYYDGSKTELVARDKQSGAARTIATGTNLPGSTAVDPQTKDVYFTDSLSSATWALRRVGASFPICSANDGPASILQVSPTHVYLRTDRNVTRCNKNGGAPEHLDDTIYYYPFAWWAGRVYYQGNSGEVWTARDDGTDRRSFAKVDGYLSSVHADASGIYVGSHADTSTALVRLDAAGQATDIRRVLGDSPVMSVLAIDARAIYFVDYSLAGVGPNRNLRTLYRIAKP